MSPFLLYIARAGLYLGLFYAFYLLLMRRTTFFRLNRTLLLSGSYLCLLLPLIRLRSVSTVVGVPEPTLVDAGADSVATDALTEPVLHTSFPWGKVLLVLYLIGAALILTLYLLSAWKMRRIMRSGERTEREGCRLIVMEQDAHSFSWGRVVVMSRKDLQENPAIFTHERMHVRHRHSLDLLLLLPIHMLFWWNPLVWIIREELRLLHEFEADEGVLREGVDAAQYQLLLVRKAVGEQRFSLASGFRHARLKERIGMMLRPASSGRRRWFYLLPVPVLAACMFACNPARNHSEPAPPVEEEVIPFMLVEQKPSFEGGDASGFSVWVNHRLVYPYEAKQKGIQGRVTVQFIVGEDGAVRNVSVLQSAHALLDAEAIRVISASPKWEPGRQLGRAVPVTYTFPVVFILR